MSSYFDEASLVMIPSGYKDQKIYSVKPLDGAGDLVFSRASGATRVASNGLIEKVRTNLQTYSQDFSNAVWTITNGTATHSQTDPNGGTTATKITFSSIGALETTLSGLSTSTAYTLSIYVKSESGSVSFEMGNINGGVYETRTATTSWQRFQLTQTPSGSTRFPAWVRSTGAATLYVAFAQAEVSDFGPTDYIATTSAAVSVGPVSGLPRLDYLGSTCPRLLLEPQRTNLALYSEQFNNSSWNPVNATITANAATSPDGYTNADQFSFTASLDSSCYQALSGSSAIYSISIFAKYVSGGKYLYIFSPTNSDSAKVWFDIEAGTVANQISGFTGTIQNYGNGWFRCTLTNTSNKSLDYMQFGISSTSNSRTLSANSVTYFYGAQVEAGAYPTSYVPTLGSSVTRVADACSKTGISSLIGQTEGTLFCEVSFKTNDAGTYLSIEDWANLELIRVYSDAGPLNAQVYNGANVFLSQTSYNAVVGQSYKMALAYSTSGAAFYVNGVLVSQATASLSIPTCANVQLGAFTSGQAMNADIKQALLFKTRLSNSDLATLTSL